MPIKHTLLTLDELLKPKDQTYVWHVPSLDKDAKLRRLTHGEVLQLNQDVRDAGFRVTDDIRNRVIAQGLVEPAMTPEQVVQSPGHMDDVFGELYGQIATECHFLTIQPAVERPLIYLPIPLHEEDERLLATQFTLMHEPRPVEETADPLGSDPPPSSSS